MADIYISLGSNINPDFYVRQGVKALETRFDKLILSSVYESEPVGFSGDNFYNMVIKAKTSLDIAGVIAHLKAIEQYYGRLPNAKKFTPRTLDLDLLLYDSIISCDPVELPRAEITTNAFVLQPLAELEPRLTHPVLQQTYQQLWEQFDKKSQKLTSIKFDWNGYISK